MTGIRGMQTLHVLFEPVPHLNLYKTLFIDAFTPDRLDVIRLLLAQAAIAYDNAQLFNEVTQLNQTLEQKVERRTLEIRQ